MSIIFLELNLKMLSFANIAKKTIRKNFNFRESPMFVKKISDFIVENKMAFILLAVIGIVGTIIMGTVSDGAVTSTTSTSTSTSSS